MLIPVKNTFVHFAPAAAGDEVVGRLRRTLSVPVLEQPSMTASPGRSDRSEASEASEADCVTEKRH